MIHHVQQNLSSPSPLHLLRRGNKAGGNMEAWDSMMASTCNPSIQEVETEAETQVWGWRAGSGVKSTGCYSKKPQFPTPTENNHL